MYIWNRGGYVGRRLGVFLSRRVHAHGSRAYGMEKDIPLLEQIQTKFFILGRPDCSSLAGSAILTNTLKAN
jgi:hypothetical protein